MHIRRATPDDALTLAKLNVPVQALHVHERPELFRLPADDNEMTVVFQGLLTDPEYVITIGEADGQPVGYVVAHVVRRPENPYHYAMEMVDIDALSVNPDQQGKGYGKLLMQAVFDLARELEIGRVVLSVWAFNTEAIGFYERLGFTPYMIWCVWRRRFLRLHEINEE